MTTVDTVGTELTDGRVGRYMQLASGRLFWPLDPRAEEVRIEDIAHALAQINRFGGHAREAYSVASHSMHVASLVERTHPHLALAALLHDAAEAYVGDVVRAIKPSLRVQSGDSLVWFTTMEHRIIDAIFTALQVPALSAEDHDVIKHADNVALATEARDLMGNPGWPGLPEPDAAPVEPVSPSSAERAFLCMFKRLKAQSPKP